MQAIILAAGMGKRLGEYTKDNTKCMLPINGIRLIDRTLTILSKLHINRVIIVVGYQAQNLINHIGNRYDDVLKIEYVNNPIYDKTNNIYSLALAKQQMMEDDTILLESDLIYEESIIRLLIDNPYPNLALVAKWESWMDGTVVKIDNDNNIINFIPKQAFNYEESNLYYKTVNIYKFSRTFATQKYIPFLDAYCNALGNNEYYEQVLRLITYLNTDDIKALPIGHKKWYEIDDIQDLDIAENIFATGKEKLNRIERRYGGHWRFPKMLDYCYLVNPYFPTAKMKDEMRANFDTLLTEYPSGMYINSLLAAKYFDIRQQYTVVGNGAAELIKSIMQIMKGKIGIIYPTFMEYPNRCNKDDIIAYTPDTDDLTYHANDLMAFYANKDINTLLLINPDNPSGNYIPKEEILELIAWCNKLNIHLIVDESFVDFTSNFENSSLLTNKILEENPNLIVVKSISKSYGVPGMRLGIIASSDISLIDQVKNDVAIWNINSFGEFYMQIFGKYSKDYTKACHRFIAERERFYNELNKIDHLHVIPSQANYFLIKITGKYTSKQLTMILLEKYEILIKDCDNKDGLEGKNFVRIAVRDTNDNNRLIQALREVM